MVRQLIIETGAVRGKNRRALDSTVLDDAVARQDTVTQLIAAVRRVGREVPGAAELVAVCIGYDYTQPGKPQIAWDDPAARDELVSVLVNDALALLAALDVERSPRPAGSRPKRSRCWRWSPGRTWSRPRGRTAPMAGGGSPGRSPRTG